MGSLVKPLPPVRRYADVVRQLVCSMALVGFGGHKRIAETLARAGWKISKRTVGRMRKEKPPLKPEEPTIQKPSRASLRAKYPNHIFMADITEIPGFLGIFSFKLALVLDVFSRMPLCFRLFWKEPTASALSQLMQQAGSFFGASKHFVSDQGSQFIASSFRETLKQLGTKQRFGALGKTGSIALIERLWRTLKDILKLKSFKPLVKNELERRITQGLHYYAYFRPHQGLNGATPAEVYFGIEPARDKAVHPPRGRPGEGSLSIPYRIQDLDKEQRLPVVFSKAA